MTALVDRLVDLGFSVYEARAYVGLLAHGEATGYALSNHTGVPQPKVYESLRRLVERGAAVKVGDAPARYAALPAARLLDDLEARFRRRLQEAHAEAERLGPGTAEWQEPVLRTDSWSAIRARSAALLDGAERKLYVTGWPDQLAELSGPLLDADARGVEIVMLHFGDVDLRLEHGQAFRHASTEGALYPKHRSRQLGVVADSRVALWALAPDGDDWGATYTEDYRLVSAIKAYVRHDIYVQKVYAELGEEMRAAFGPGLEYLTNVSSKELLGDRKERRRGRAG